MRGWDTCLAASIIAILCILTFSLGSKELGISRAALEQGEWVRCFSFMFAHNDAIHLLTNLAALAFVTLIARELKISGLAFLAVFIGVGFLVIIPALLAFGSFVFMGASAGISALFGITTVKIRQYGLPGPTIFIMFVLALGISSAIDVWLTRSVESAIQFCVHLTALILGAELTLIYGERTHFIFSRGG
jgi:membrane associated rhomboid family serine protease